MLNVEKIYVTHYTKLTERKKRLDDFLLRNNISAEFITIYDRDDLSQDFIKKCYTANEKDFNNTIGKAYGATCVPYRHINLPEISCTLKHYEAIRRLSVECKEYGLVFEDDVIGVDNFVNLFNEYLAKTPSDWDAIFMGGCCGLRIDPSATVNGQIAFHKGHPASKCGDGYMLKTSLAKKMAETMMPFNTISDWELSYQLYLHNAKVYWWEPPLLSQGSETGLFKSELR